MAFAPMPVGTAEVLRKLQTSFLWGMGHGGANKIAWVKWGDICRKKGGGLGVRNWRWFNLALLAKWVWRFVRYWDSLWARIICARHGNMAEWELVGTNSRSRGKSSGWWRKIVSSMEGEFGDWFLGKIWKKVGDGRDTSFWDEKWCGDQPLRRKYPRLYQLCDNKGGCVGEMGRWVDGNWIWEVRWRRQLNNREGEWEAELLRSLHDCKIEERKSDKWCWGDKNDQEYSVKEAYLFLSTLNSAAGNYNSTCARVWKSIAPFKQQVMAWRVLRDRIPTRDNLQRRMPISPEGRLCPCCAIVPETTTHILLHCQEVDCLWRKMVEWIGADWAAPYGIAEHFDSFSTIVGSKSAFKRLSGLWICIIWVIWRWRNKIIFENWTWDFKKMEEEVRSRFWSWCVLKGITDPTTGFTNWSRRILCKEWRLD